MSPKAKHRVEQTDHWIGEMIELIPLNIRRTLVTTIATAALGYIGMQANSNGNKVDEIRQAMRLELNASRTNWTGRASTSNALVRIEAKLDQLLLKGDKP